MPVSATMASTRSSGRSNKPTVFTKRAACGAFFVARFDGGDFQLGIDCNAALGPDAAQRVTSSSRIGMAVIGAVGALMAATGVALSAYAAHAAEPTTQLRLYTAAAFAFGHGAALAALAGNAPRRLTRVALSGLVLGTVLFAGSLVGAALLQTSTALAPAGGLVLIGSWLLLAVDRLRG